MQKSFVVGFGLILILIAATVYFFFFGGQDLLFHKSAPDTGTDITSTTAVRGQPQPFSEGQAVGATLSVSGDAVWYFDEKGQLLRQPVSGALQSFGLENPEPVVQAYWPLAGNDFIIRSLNAGTERFRWYDSARGVFVILPPQVESLAWLSDGRRIAYIWRYADGRRELKLAKPDTTEYQTLATVSRPYEIIASPDGDILVLIDRFNGIDSNIVQLFHINTATSVSFLDRGQNIDMVFSPDGRRMLFSRVNPDSRLPELWTVDMRTNEFTRTSLIGTVEKAAWAPDSESFYAAVPQDALSGDFRLFGRTSDILSEYDLSGKFIRGLPVPAGSAPIDIRRILVGPGEDQVFFLNARDGRIWKADLP